MRSHVGWLPIAIGATACAIVAGNLLDTVHSHGFPRHLLASYRTSLRGRTASQRYNATLAARALDRAVVMPGDTFSFNRRVASWTRERGYLPAPVSYEGVLAESVGGGVCQVSTTLYNALLLAGLSVVERHRHAVAPGYVPPGRDAAVAQSALDLRFVNALGGPLLIRSECTSNSLAVRLYSTQPPRYAVSLITRVLDVAPPRPHVRAEHLSHSRRLSHVYRPSRGVMGWHVVTYRCYMAGDREVRRELVSSDTYRSVDFDIGMTEQFADPRMR